MGPKTRSKTKEQASPFVKGDMYSPATPMTPNTRSSSRKRKQIKPTPSTDLLPESIHFLISDEGSFDTDKENLGGSCKKTKNVLKEISQNIQKKVSPFVKADTCSPATPMTPNTRSSSRKRNQRKQTPSTDLLPESLEFLTSDEESFNADKDNFDKKCEKNEQDVSQNIQKKEHDIFLNENKELKKLVEMLENRIKEIQMDKNKRIATLEEENSTFLDKLSSLKAALREKDLENVESVLELKNEYLLMKMKAVDAQSKYNHLACTPPPAKYRVNSVSIEETENLKNEVEEMKNKMKTMQEEHKLEMSAINKCQDKKLTEKEEELHKANEKLLQYDNIAANHRLMKQHLDLALEQLKRIANENNVMKSQLHCLNRSLKENVETVKNKIVKAADATNTRCREMYEWYAREMELRKRLHNELVDLRGSIRVFCRVRPVIAEDGSNVATVVGYVGEDDTTITIETKDKKQRNFFVDKVFPPSASQTKIFEEVSTLVTSCMDGYNVCIFAYGQTGSGKTYTMEGTERSPGINKRALARLFEECQRRHKWKFTIHVSYLEIYNESLRDLLSNEQQKLEIKLTTDGQSHVPGLTKVAVTNARDVNEVISLGSVNRSTASTNMNQHSSRSHSVFTITIEGRNIDTNATSLGKLNLVDLAGSERLEKSGAEGARQKEAQCINTSLSALSTVIGALQNKNNKHVPYRNSKLTFLLKDSLGGNSKTLMLVQLSPIQESTSETLSSLNFAEKAKKVELGKASKNR